MQVKRIWDNIKNFFRHLGRHKDDLGDVIKNRHRFVIMDEETYREKFSFQLTGINIFVTLGISTILLVLITFLLIAFTPLREFIPGYTNTKLTKQTYRNAVVIDSLETLLGQQEQQLADIKAILMGENPDELRAQADTLQGGQPSARENGAAAPTTEYRHSKEDSLLREEVEHADKYSLRHEDGSSESRSIGETTPVSMQLFFTPVKGKVISPYNPGIKHYGVDVAGTEGDAVKAIMSGTVLFASFTVETGYIVAIQHSENYISIYKHNSALLVHSGDLVRAGEPIAFLGNSGELTSGPHLHFELWQNGKAVNPLLYISF